MKKIILDHFRRWWLMMTLIGIVFFIFTGFLGREAASEAPEKLLNQIISTAFIFQIIIFYLGIFLTLDLQRGLARVLTTLPMTTKKIGRALWLASVAIPAVALTATGCLALFVFSIDANKAMPLGNYLVVCLIAAPTLGAAFGAMTFTTTAIPETLIDRVCSLFSNICMVLLFLGFIYFDKKNPNILEASLIFSGLTILTFVGWFRAEHLVASRAGFRVTAHPSKKRATSYKPLTRFGGIRFIYWTAFFIVWIFGIYFFIIMNLLNFVTKHQFDWHHLTRNIDSGVVFFPLFFSLVFMRAGFSFNHNLRFLRTMPVSTAKLAATLLSVQILPLLTLVMAFTALAWKETGLSECISFFKIELLAVAPSSVFIAVSIWNTQGNIIKGVLLAILIVATMSPTFYQFAHMDGRGLPFWVITVFDIAMLGFVFWSTCQILSKSSSAYRPRQNQLGNRWGWLGSER